MLDVIALPAFNDNYIWLLRLRGDQRCWVVDPGEAAPVQSYLQAHQQTLEGILITHHHPDHIGGIADLMQPSVTLVGSAGDAHRLPPLTLKLGAGSRLQVLGQTVQVLEVPGHTSGHLAYYIADQQPPLLFCGDTLFAGGCGRLFEGSAEQMHASLESLATLAAATRVYAAHEYTLKNLEFALQVEPDNQALQQRYQQCQQLRAAGRPTLPSCLAEEKATNPFLRIDQPGVLAAVRSHTGQPELQEPGSVFAALRRWKDAS